MDCAANRSKVDRWLLASSTAGLVAALLLAASAYLAYWRGYYDGARLHRSHVFISEVVLLLLAVGAWMFALGLAFFAVVQTFRCGGKLSAVRIALLGMLLLATPLTCIAQEPGAVFHLRGFRDGIRTQDVDYDAIRTWRRNYADAAHEKVPQNEWPPQIEQLLPGFVVISPGGDTEIWYGSGFGHWGITIHALGTNTSGRFAVAPGVDAWYSE